MIVGSDGQDGQLLSQRLRRSGCEILGITRAGSGAKVAASEKLNIRDAASITDALGQWEPDAIFYLPAIHAPAESKSAVQPGDLFNRSIDVHVTGAVNFLSALEHVGSRSSFFYAASSLMFGEPDEPVQNENTDFRPDSIYAITKAAGVYACRHFRKTSGVKASCGILYNHESPLRQRRFISQRIVTEAVAISKGLADELVVGDLSAIADWGYAPDFVDAMIRIAELPKADDFVIATGEPHSVQDFVEEVFICLDMDWQRYVREDRSLVTPRPALIGNSSRLRERTGWRPTVSFAEMIRILVDAAMSQ
jgi:GDPmannose 4,6-dehydratase